MNLRGLKWFVLIMTILIGGLFCLFTDEDGPIYRSIDTGTDFNIMADRGIVDVEVDSNYESKGAVCLIAIVDDTHVFKGWYDGYYDLFSDEQALYVEESDATLYAFTELKPVAVVELDSDYGIEKTDGSGEYPRGSGITVSAYTKSGFEFDGWFDSRGDMVGSERVLNLEAQDLKLTARSHSDTPSGLRVNAGEGIASVSGYQDLCKGETASMKAELLPGWYITGWYAGDELMSNTETLVMSADEVTLSVKASRTQPSFLEIHTGEGISSTTGSGYYAAGTKTAVTASVMKGYTFEGWFDSLGNRISDELSAEVVIGEGDTHMYARAHDGYSLRVYGTLDAPYDKQLCEYAPDEYVVLEPRAVNGMVFKGWYTLDGHLLTDRPVYVPDRASSAVVCVMSNPVQKGTNKIVCDDFPSWYDETCHTMVFDFLTEANIAYFSGTDTSPVYVPAGEYCIEYIGDVTKTDTLREYDRISFDGKIEQTYEWDYRGYHSITIESCTGDLVDYQNKDVNRWPYDHEVHEFVDYNSDFVNGLAVKLQPFLRNMDDLEKAEFILKFVQKAVFYEFDDRYFGEEYYKFPYETLMDHRGDCEDKSVLFVSLMKNLGYDAVILLFEGHEAAAVNVDTDGTFFEHGGKKYFACETTGVSAIGVWNWDGEYDDPKILEIP